MLTKNEAKDRAARIWGAGNILQVERRGSDGSWYVDIADLHGLHILDGNGHTVCHPECARLEEKLP